MPNPIAREVTLRRVIVYAMNQETGEYLVDTIHLADTDKGPIRMYSELPANSGATTPTNLTDAETEAMTLYGVDAA